MTLQRPQNRSSSGKSGRKTFGELWTYGSGRDCYEMLRVDTIPVRIATLCCDTRTDRYGLVRIAKTRERISKTPTGLARCSHVFFTTHFL